MHCKKVNGSATQISARCSRATRAASSQRWRSESLSGLESIASQRIAVHGRAVHGSARHRNAVQCKASQCSAMQSNAASPSRWTRRVALRTQMHCSAGQGKAGQRNEKQRGQSITVDSPSRFLDSRARHGKAAQSRAEQRIAMQGNEKQRGQSITVGCPSRFLDSRAGHRNSAQRMAEQGRAGHGSAMKSNAGSPARWIVQVVLAVARQARRGEARSGSAWPGGARHDTAGN